ncbi:MAG: hypothetical protein SFT93_01010, partial [Rickettsiaceae bacterium]|nr:hypothetical protein [Rickettsiaceae bacterium]
KKEQQNMKDVREKLLTKAQETLEEIYNTIGWGKTYESKKPAAITEERILQQIEKEASTFEEEYRELYKDIIGKIRDLKQKELPDIITVSSARETLSKTVSDIKTGLESSKQSTKKEEDTTQSKTTSTSTYKNKPFEAEFKEINIISELLYDFSSDDSSTQSQNNLLAKLYYDLGNLYCKIGRLEHGSIAYTNATELDSSYENAYVNAITTYFIQGFSIEVLSVCKELVKISPPLNRSFAYLLSSIALKDIGLEEEAKNVLQKFLETAEPVTKSLETLSQAALVESSDKPSDEMPIATSDYEELITMVRDGILSNIVPDWQMDEISNWRGARIEYDTKDSLNRRVVREYYQKILDPLRTEVTKRLQDNPPNNQETIEQKTQEAVVRKTEDDLGDVKVVAKWIEDIIGKCQSFSKLYTSYKAKLAITKSESIESASQKKFIIDAMVDYTSTIHKEVHIISDEVQTLRAHGSQEDSVDQAFLHYLKQNQTLPGYKFLYQVVESTLLGETNQAYEDIFDQN